MIPRQAGRHAAHHGAATENEDSRGQRPAHEVIFCGVPVLRDELARVWLGCPVYSRRCKHLYIGRDDEGHVLACRGSLRPDYTSRHLHRSLPSVHRITRWRRQLGIDLHPFAPIPKRQRHHLRYYRTVAKILLEEEVLRGHLNKIANDLERRARVRKIPIIATNTCFFRRHQIADAVISATTSLRNSGAKVTPGGFNRRA
jgi:hypothetical protein